jgi:hypothetical protein
MKTLLTIFGIYFCFSIHAQSDSKKWEHALFSCRVDNVSILKTTVTIYDTLTSAEFNAFKSNCLNKEEIIDVVKLNESEVAIYYTNSFFQNDLSFFLNPFSHSYLFSKEIEYRKAQDIQQEMQKL